MRLLRFDFRDDFSSVDLHPLITVVSGLEPARQRQLFEAIRRLSNGSTVGLRGLVEHQGLLVELDAGTGDPLGSVTTDAPVLIYVDGLAVRSCEVGLQAEIEELERQAAIDAVAVEEIRSDLDLVVRAKALELRRLMEPNFVDGPDNGLSPRKMMIATVREAFEGANAHEPEVAHCDPAVLQLLERWEAYRVMHDEAEEHLFQIHAQVSEAQAAVNELTAALDVAVVAARPVLLNAEQEARLEALTDRSNASADSNGSSLRGKRKRGLSTEEKAERQQLLDLVGVHSWTEYSVFRMSPTASPEKLAAVAKAEAELGVARQALEQAKTQVASDPLAVQLHHDLERLKTDCQPFLGVLVPNDIGAALREQIVQVENPDWVAAMNHLRDALSSNDIHHPYGLEPDEIVGWTDSWLRAEESFDTAQTNDGTSGSSDSADSSDAAPVAMDSNGQPRDLKAESEEVNRLLIRHNRALAQIDKAERAAVRSAIRVRALKQQLRVRSSGPEVSTAAAVLAMVAPVAEQVLRDVGGSLPLAIVGDMEDLPQGEVEAMMRALEEVATQVQVILVTPHEGIADWVRRAGLQRASEAMGLRALM
ncbi:MAG: hypothetical protein ACRBK7_02400 [Acidimicrobiales bacterium]